MAERLWVTVGGAQSVRAMLIDRLKINPDEFLMSSASGLGTNRVTPRAMMRILRGLSAELKHDKLSLLDILPVAGIDPGTLEDRFTTDIARGSVVAKTGTLARTDGGASSLVGQMQTKSGRVVLFVILNEHGNVLLSPEPGRHRGCDSEFVWWSGAISLPSDCSGNAPRRFGLRSGKKPW